MLLFWFRRDLRLHDNAGLFHALASGKPVLPLFIFDRAILAKLEDKADARVSFIHDTVTKMQRELEDSGSTLLVKYGEPLEVLSELLNKYEVEGIYTNRDYEPYAQERDKAMAELAQQHQVEFSTFKDQVIFEKSEIMTQSGTPYKVYTPYKNAWKKAFTSEMAAPYTCREYFRQLLPHFKTNLPTLQEIGFTRSKIEVPPHDLSPETLSAYHSTRNLPALDATSRLSPHLRFGTVSVREAVKEALAHNDVWLQELIWREFFMQLLFHFPASADSSFSPKFSSINWRNIEEEFQRWCEGTTGFPLVDAGMRELNETGFMHNRVRMVVASFLVKDLLIDWRWGEAYFAEKLLDYEQASNVGNWQWAAGTGADAQPYFRVFNPDSQINKFDKEYAYIKRWIPEYDTSSYPKPMLDHSLARDRALETYKKAIAEAGA
ncbi:cryptochrome/photolyase family protein [Pontibacter akesuensis]|uniref:Deoxyribodipyrimidine photo-lyase n=1 Tax=Pontibacter akesuensis TaxID=388950 RepID=A0A1I7FLH0_9BACT|nr:deoxyribodipyrimidine photo-lyase [Pontibacter akesuensis]GHA61606.1 deoxyribodipyrimidine photo-lyase [Pontibacter akesuensis]SFU36988.1 deoxyribodipyrimidine photo-lyase [Pontibacter akesuensis]